MTVHTLFMINKLAMIVAERLSARHTSPAARCRFVLYLSTCMLYVITMSVTSLVTSRPTPTREGTRRLENIERFLGRRPRAAPPPQGEGTRRLVNIERFLGRRPRAAALMGRLVTRLYPLQNYNAHVRETGCT